MNGNKIECVSFYKLLGIMINDTITWNNHIDYICGKSSCIIYFVILLKRAGKSDLMYVFCSLIRSILDTLANSSILGSPGNKVAL